MSSGAPEYVLGTDAIELERLGVQHRLWADSAHRLWRRARFGSGSRLLDIGCGPGYASIDLAQLVGPEGAVVGIDESPGFVDEANRRFDVLSLPHAQAHRGDVQALAGVLPDAVEAFDGAYLRWVLCFVSDPEAVISSASQRLRSGARVVVQDYFNYASMTLAPHDDRFRVVVDAIQRSWRDRGGDPDVVGRLPAIFDAAGFDLTHLDVQQRIARKGDTMLDWPDSFWPSVVPRLVTSGHLTQAQADDFSGLWTSFREHGTRFMLPPPVFEVIATKR